MIPAFCWEAQSLSLPESTDPVCAERIPQTQLRREPKSSYQRLGLIQTPPAPLEFVKHLNLWGLLQRDGVQRGKPKRVLDVEWEVRLGLLGNSDWAVSEQTGKI